MRIVLLSALAFGLAACNQPAATKTAAEAEQAAAPVVAEAPSAPVNAVFVNQNGLAAGGYDVVSFFKNAPAEGSAEFVSEVEGAKYQFASAENKAEFDAEPAKFLPQFGGYCAYGAAEGHKASTKPETGQVINGKLYFNYNKSVQATFNKDQAGYISKAEANWDKIKGDAVAG